MLKNKILLYVGLFEIFLGTLTLSGLGISVLFSFNAKSPNVFVFVAITSCISCILGVGILIRSRFACKILIYFSSVIVLTKLLIFADIISLNGALESTFPQIFKDTLSIAYHAFLIFYLSTPKVRKIFVSSD